MMSHDELMVAMVNRTGGNVKDIELFKKEFVLTVVGLELKLMHRSYFERPLV